MTSEALKFALRRLHKLPGWLWELRQLPDVMATAKLFLAGLLVAFLASDWFGYGLGWPRVNRLPVAGWLLEMAGLATVAVGVIRLETLLRPRPREKSIRGWLSRFPLRKRDTTIAVGTAHLRLSAPRPRVSGKSKPPPAENLEQRIAAMERLAEQLQDAVSELRQQMDVEIDSLKDQITNEAKARQAETKELRDRIESKLENVLVGGIHVEVVGLLWIAVGITAATLPERVYNFWLPIYDLLEVTWLI